MSRRSRFTNKLGKAIAESVRQNTASIYYDVADLESVEWDSVASEVIDRLTIPENAEFDAWAWEVRFNMEAQTS